MTARRVLLTGASGLLGHAILEHLGPRLEVLPVACSHDVPGMVRGDLTDPAFLAALEREPWDAVVHAAALRSPDFCDAHPARAWAVNADLPVTLARLARRRGARFIQVSTDYVFAGTHPPYREEDACCPVNLYGETKYKAEQGIAAEYPGALIMRIGALYGVPRPQVPSPMMEEALALIRHGVEAEVDHTIRRYPLFVGDVARVVAFLLGQDGSRGVVQVGSPVSVTRYEWTLAIAALMGRDVPFLRPARRDLSRLATRPLDAGMATDRLRAWGGPVPPDFRETLPAVLHRIGVLPGAHAGVVADHEPLPVDTTPLLCREGRPTTGLRIV